MRCAQVQARSKWKGRQKSRRDTREVPGKVLMACLDGATGGWVLRTGVDCRILSPQSLQRRNFEALSSPPAGGAVGRGADGMTLECHPCKWCLVRLGVI